MPHFQGVGEAPLSLANSVFFAIKDAIQSARSDNELSGTFTLDSPAVGERVRLACGDNLLEKVFHGELIITVSVFMH